jgi:DNA (cytosine-5)-methyltransferase 1
MQGGGQEPKILMPQVSRENGKRQVTHTESDVVPTVLATQYKSGDTQAKVVIPVLTPERDEKRQNGRRFKENGEDMFTLTAQDRHGIMIKNNSPHTPALEARHGDNISFQPKARGSVRKGYSGTVATQPDGVLVGTRIRKLTPRECWRLQAFPDSAFDAAQAVNSDSQLYKQAGNSVTVSVIRAIGERLE